MSIISANGDERSISGGRTVRLINLTDISTAQAVLTGTETTGYRIIGGELDISGAGSFELKVGSVSKYFRVFGSAFVIGFDDEIEIGCGPSETLLAESSAVVNLSGYLIVVPSLS